VSAKVDWRSIAMRSRTSVYTPSLLPETVAGRLEFIHRLMNYPIEDEYGNVEYVALISKDTARRLLDWKR
jgi:hypothetical protein